jgi:hypothetical protein
MVPTAGKAARAGQFRYLNRPRPARVLTDIHGAPRSVAVGRQAARVIRIRDRWRVDDQWWREPLCRMYWEVELQDGRVLTLYHDRPADAWFVQPYGP